MRIVIVTGLSGAGKSTALRALEDYGFYCVDNMPLPLATRLVEWMAAEAVIKDLALAVDARQHQYLDSYRRELDRLTSQGHELDVLYLDATEECLLRRYSATRRLHPLAGNDLITGIRRDREILSELCTIGDVIDTTPLTVHQLKAVIQDRYHGDHGRLAVILLSFGFKHGVPPEANLLFDVRFLPNPYFDPSLSDRDGRDPGVAGYVLESENAHTLLGHIETMLRFTLPLFEKERKLYLTVAIGCTGGRHRSVAIAEEIGRRLQGDWDVLLKHRDLDRRT